MLKWKQYNLANVAGEQKNVPTLNTKNMIAQLNNICFCVYHNGHITHSSLVNIIFQGHLNFKCKQKRHLELYLNASRNIKVMCPSKQWKVVMIWLN